MRFYVVEDDYGNTLGCTTQLLAARDLARDTLAPGAEYTVHGVDVEVCAESVRRLLAQCGGYAERLRVQSFRTPEEGRV